MRVRTLAALAALAAASAARADFAQDVRPFLDKHCVACHGPKKQQASVRLDELDRYRPEDAPLWTKVHEALRAGTMPPDGRPAPDKAERQRLLSWVEARQQPGVVPLRRLNRREVGAALRDVTGLAIDFEYGLPGDAKLNGFDTGAAALEDAADSVAALVKVTRRAVDAVRFLGPPGEPMELDLRQAKDAKKAFDSWKGRDVVYRGRLVPAPGKGMLLQPHWVGERDVVGLQVPVSKEGRGVLRLKLTVAALKPVAGLPNPRLWVEAGGRDVDFCEVTGTLEKPQELTYEIQLDDLAIQSKGVKLSLSNKVEIPYSVEGYENEEVVRKGEEPPPGGTGWFRPLFDRKTTAPQKQPAPWVVLQRIEIDPDHVAAWPPAGWGAKLGPVRDDDASAKRLLALWASRAWRRPAAEADLGRFFALYRKLRDGGAAFDDALRAACQSVLMSARFRYLASPSQGDAEARRYAVASRLAFLLWGEPPDAALLASAASGKLDGDLPAHIDRLLADPRSDGFFRPFVVQWLEMEQPITIASSSLRRQDFRFARHLKASMKEETLAYVRELFLADRPAREFLSSDWTMMNDALAVHYGYRGVEGGRLRKVTLRRDDPRGGGVLGHAGVQSMLCWMGGNWVIYRGAWVMRHVLDDPPPPPPLEVPELNASEKANHGKSFKQLLKQHQEDANCAVCHRKMDPVGFAFQNFDLSGRWRGEEYDAYHMGDLDGRIEWRGVGKARPVDAAGHLPRGEKFSSFAEAKGLMVKHYTGDFVRGLLKELIVYAAGRLPGVHDLAWVRSALAAHEAKGYPLGGVLKALLLSRVFLGR